MNERRAETRMLCSELVDVHWKDVTGRQIIGVFEFGKRLGVAALTLKTMGYKVVK